MAVDLNADVGKIIKDLFAGKKSGKNATGKVEKDGSIFSSPAIKQSILKSILAVCVTIMLSYLVHNVTSNPIKKLTSDYKNSIELEEAITKMDLDTQNAKRMFKNNSKKINEIMPKFSNLHGSKTIFKQITQIASEYGLIIKNLNQTNRKNLDKPIKHSEVEILLEMNGYYPNYVSFKKKLAMQKPYLKTNREILLLNFNKSGERRIDITLALTDYAIEKEKYKEIVQASY